MSNLINVYQFRSSAQQKILNFRGGEKMFPFLFTRLSIGECVFMIKKYLPEKLNMYKFQNLDQIVFIPKYRDVSNNSADAEDEKNALLFANFFNKQAESCD